jgi:hypothetical protein
MSTCLLPNCHALDAHCYQHPLQHVTALKMLNCQPKDRPGVQLHAVRVKGLRPRLGGLTATLLRPLVAKGLSSKGLSPATKVGALY